MKFHIFFAFAFISCITISIGADSTPEASAKVEIHSCEVQGFTHPGIGLTKKTLENARAQVRAKREPWFSGFNKIAANPNSAEKVSCRNQSRNDPSKPDSDALDSRGMVARLAQDSDKAYRQALMYIFTGKENYRANALNIIRVWSKMDPSKFKSFPEDHIHASYPIQNLIRAAELMRYTSSSKGDLEWTEQDTKTFTENFVTPSLTTFLDRNGHFMNQAGYPMAAAMAGDIFTNDRKNYERRVEWFTANKNAPNKGWSYSITDLARLVDTDALTGKKADHPQVQLIEMGRDQAHAGDDVEIFMNISRMMNAQETKVDPVTGTISGKSNAVGPYEFLDDRILAAADYFCRFMLGYDTPWIPATYDIAADSKVRAIYPRIADNYRGRIRGFDFWDAHFYYESVKRTDVKQKAPYYHEAFAKRIVQSETDWLFIPENVSGEGARVPPTEQQPASVDLAIRSTQFDKNASVVKERDHAFVRVTPATEGTRFAVLSCDSNQKNIGMRIRTNGPALIEMSRFRKSWLLPDTRNEWRNVTYRMDDLEKLGDIVFLTVKAPANTVVDFDQLIREPRNGESAPEFTGGNDEFCIVSCIGVPVELDLSVKEKRVVFESIDKPEGATLNSETGAFKWTPRQVGDFTFMITASDGKFIAPKKVHVIAAADRSSSLRALTAVFDPKIRYVQSTLKKCEELHNQIATSINGINDRDFSKKLMELQAAFDGLQPLTPLLTDGSMNYPKVLVTTTTQPGEIALLTDANDDTFAVYTSAKGLGHIFDFGEDFRFSATAFAAEGRLNFENRTQDAAFFGSNDGKDWAQLTPEIKTLPTELTRVEVNKDQRDKRFRYLKFQKINQKSAPIFEPSELRIYGERHEAK